MPSEGKIKSKDLSYESTLPPFLQRLHAQKAGLGDEDRHERPIARPKRVKANDEDDGPTVVDESGEMLSKEEMEKMSGGAEKEGEDIRPTENGKGAGDGDEEEKSLSNAQDGNAPKTDQKITDGMASKKRKVAKVVGEEDRDLVVEKAYGKEPKVKKAKKKAKPIKLAFNEDDEP